jgi:hypothetical protein
MFFQLQPTVLRKKPRHSWRGVCHTIDGDVKMMIISFSWTSDAFKAGRKSKTRRQWTIEYAKRFKVGDICKAYNKQPRFGGKQIGLLKIISKTYEIISDMPDSDFETEGFAYMQEQGLKIWNQEPEDAFWNWQHPTEDEWYWVIEFEKIK